MDKKYDISVLYIDDDEMALEYFKVIAGNSVEKITTAQSGVKGIEEFYNENPDIVIVDIVMPDIDGVEVAQKIKSKFPETEIAAVSSTSLPEYLIGAINAGIRNFILKPLTKEKLCGIFEEVSQRVEMKKELQQYKDKLENLVNIRTERLQRANEKLILERESKKRIEKRAELFSNAIENMDMPIIITDRNFYIEYANKKACILKGKNDIEGDNLFMLFPELDRKIVEEHIRTKESFLIENFRIEKVYKERLDNDNYIVTLS